MADNSSLLIGGAIGFVSAVLAPIVVESLRTYALGPKLQVEFLKDDGCFRTETIETSPSHDVTDARYVRVRVRNTKSRIAKQCSAYLVKVEKWDESRRRFQATIYCDSIQLAWSARGDEAYQRVDLPKDIDQFVDVLSTRRIDRHYRMEVKARLFRYVNLFREHGRFRYTVQVSGDNVEPELVRIIFEWNGDWENFIVNAG